MGKTEKNFFNPLFPGQGLGPGPQPYQRFTLGAFPDLYFLPGDLAPAAPQGLKNRLFGSKTGCQGGMINTTTPVAVFPFGRGKDPAPESRRAPVNCPADSFYLDEIDANALYYHALPPYFPFFPGIFFSSAIHPVTYCILLQKGFFL
jgi:hypothetical protein